MKIECVVKTTDDLMYDSQTDALKKNLKRASGGNVRLIEITYLYNKTCLLVFERNADIYWNESRMRQIFSEMNEMGGHPKLKLIAGPVQLIENESSGYKDVALHLVRAAFAKLQEHGHDSYTDKAADLFMRALKDYSAAISSGPQEEQDKEPENPVDRIQERHIELYYEIRAEKPDSPDRKQIAQTIQDTVNLMFSRLEFLNTMETISGDGRTYSATFIADPVIASEEPLCDDKFINKAVNMIDETLNMAFGPDSGITFGFSGTCVVQGGAGYTKTEYTKAEG